MSEREKFSAQGMTVVRMTKADAAIAQAQFDALVAEKTASGEINEHNFGQMYASLWASVHDGCEGVEVIPEPAPAA